MKVITSSPFWFMPVARILIRPKPGRLSEARISTTSASVVNGVVGVDRLEPFQFAKAERRADRADRFAATPAPPRSQPRR